MTDPKMHVVWVEGPQAGSYRFQQQVQDHVDGYDDQAMTAYLLQKAHLLKDIHTPDRVNKTGRCATCRGVVHPCAWYSFAESLLQYLEGR